MTDGRHSRFETADPSVTRRRFLAGVAGTGSMASIAGCGGDSPTVSIHYVGVQDFITGVQVTAMFGNAAERQFRILARARVTVGTGEDAETFQKSKQTTLAPMGNTEVNIQFNRGQILPGTFEEAVDAEAWAEFLDADRPTTTPVQCTMCAE